MSDNEKRIKDFKQWTKSQKNNEPLFSIISKDDKGKIISVLRLKDSVAFSINTKHPAVHFDSFEITEFYHDLRGVNFYYSVNGEGVATGIMLIDDITLHNDEISDTGTERLLKAMDSGAMGGFTIARKKKKNETKEN